MKKFTDSTGHEWEITLTIGSVKRVRELAKVDLLAIEDPIDHTKKDDPALLTELGTDIVLLCDVIFAIVEPQAKEAGITDITFGHSLGGEVIEAAQEAFYDELVLFSQGRRRGDLAEAIGVQRKLIEMGRTELESAIVKVGRKATADMTKSINEKVEEMLGETSGNSQESAASTPSP